MAKDVIRRGAGVVPLQLLDLPPGGFETGDGLADDRVAPLQMAALPAEVEAQGLAVPLQDVVLRSLDGYGPVPAFHQPVARQLGAVVVVLLVEPPVLRDPQSSVPQALAAGVVTGRAAEAISSRKSSGFPCSVVM